MKKNLLRLLAIAFAVALLSTFLFYRLLLGKLASEEAAQPPAAAAGMKPEPGPAVPAGMRAVSIHVVDSNSVTAMVQPGHRIDIHAVGNRDSSALLRTVLQNVEVLAGPGTDPGPQRPGAQMLTVLVKPEEADLLALADSGARIRISLRNHADPGLHAARRLAVGQLFEAAARPPARQAEASVALLVHMLGATPAAVQSLSAGLLTPLLEETLQVSAFRPDSDIETRLSRLGEQVQVLSAASLVARYNREVSTVAGPVRVKLVPAAGVNGTIRLRLESEFSGGGASRRLETEVELADRQSCLLAGLVEPNTGPAQFDRLYSGRRFLIAVTPRAAR